MLTLTIFQTFLTCFISSLVNLIYYSFKTSPKLYASSVNFGNGRGRKRIFLHVSLLYYSSHASIFSHLKIGAENRDISKRISDHKIEIFCSKNMSRKKENISLLCCTVL